MSCRPTWSGRTAAPPRTRSRLFDLEKAYFTSRGIGVIDVNYGGSTGYGRSYRERLRMQWGVVNVEDVASAALALADKDDADPAPPRRSGAAPRVAGRRWPR